MAMITLKAKNFALITEEWAEIHNSDVWHEGIYYALCAAYALVSLAALVSVIFSHFLGKM